MCGVLAVPVRTRQCRRDVEAMENSKDVREFLTSRRSRITPAQAGIPAYGGGSRRVAGLKREEVAMLAGVSTEYYSRFERGTSAVCPNPSWSPWPTPFGSIRLNGPTCSTWQGQPGQRGHQERAGCGRNYGPAFSGSWKG